MLKTDQAVIKDLMKKILIYYAPKKYNKTNYVSIVCTNSKNKEFIKRHNYVG